MRPSLSTPIEAKSPRHGDTVYIDEVFAGVPDHSDHRKAALFWRAVDQDGEIVGVYLQSKRDGAAA
jgi:putative transposase